MLKEYNQIRIGFDTQVLQSNKGGTGIYIQELIRSLKKVDSRNSYITLNFHNRLPRKNNFTKICNVLIDLFYIHFMVPYSVLSKNIDIIHFPANIIPIFSPCLSVVTIHDMMFVRYPEFYDPDFLKFARLFFPLSARRADKIITISEFSKKDIVRFCCVAEEKVEVVYLGVEPEFFRVKDNTANAFVSSRYGLGKKPYVFFAGEFGPRKNLENLIKAIAKLKLMNKCKEIELVLVGARRTTGYLCRIETLIKELGLEGDVRWLDFVPRSHLRYLLKSARVSVYVSLCEGFGLPIIEAMAIGTPVVCSNGSSMTEIAGNAAVIVDPREVSKIADAIFRLLTQPKLVAEYIARGKRRALKFTWENTAAKTIEIYKSLLSAHEKKI